jgi:hypothetical protein
LRKINYDGKIFRTIVNTENGEVSKETIFYYHQMNCKVWAEYSGGDIVHGHLVAIADDSGNLVMSYHHINKDNEIMTGRCHSRPELLDDGRLRMHEEWEWTCKDRSKGYSVIEEIRNQ